MRPRQPSQYLVVDSNIILGVVLGRKSKALFDAVLAMRPLLTSARSRQEVIGVASQVDPNVARSAAVLVETLSVTVEERYAAHLDAAASALRHAVPSRNGNTADAHVLALAWSHDADIWSHDRDFAGTGWPSWSSANLRAALDDERLPSA